MDLCKIVYFNFKKFGEIIMHFWLNSVLCLFLIGSTVCCSKITEEEKIFNKNIKELNELIVELHLLKEIKSQEEQDGSVTYIENNQKKYDFFKSNENKWLNLEKNFVLAGEQHVFLKDDALFCVALEKTIIALIVHPVEERNIIIQAINVIDKLIKLKSIKIEDFTRKSLKEGFFDGYKNVYQENYTNKESDNIKSYFTGNLGVLYQKIGNYEKAIEAYKKTINLSPKSLLADNAKEQIKFIMKHEF
jgi:tetratricopeptide (TPR) repeat protein